jgi:nicotinamidase-related amidase
MPHPNLLERSSVALVVIDVQEAFRNAIPDFAVTASRVSMAVRGFQALGVPIIVTEQYPKGLGRTAEEIQLVLRDEALIIEKTAFSSCGARDFLEHLNAIGARQVIVCGLETHICVNQTAHDLLDRGFQVHLLTDCVCSRFEYDKHAGVTKMLSAGVISSSMEMAFFELMRDSTHDQFKEIQNLIR